MVHYHRFARNDGIILMTVLVLLSALSLLALSALSVSTLQTHMNTNQAQHLQAFFQAQSMLHTAFKQIEAGNDNSTNEFDIEQLAEKLCPVNTCYTVTTTATAKHASVTLFAQYNVTLDEKTKKRTVTRAAWWSKDE